MSEIMNPIQISPLPSLANVVVHLCGALCLDRREARASHVVWKGQPCRRVFAFKSGSGRYTRQQGRCFAAGWPSETTDQIVNVVLQSGSQRLSCQLLCSLLSRSWLDPTPQNVLHLGALFVQAQLSFIWSPDTNGRYSLPGAHIRSAARTSAMLRYRVHVRNRRVQRFAGVALRFITPLCLSWRRGLAQRRNAAHHCCTSNL